MKSFRTIAIAIAVAAGVFFAAHTFASKFPTKRAAKWTQDESSRLIFFAVLEGLYTDGVSDKSVELIIGPQDKHDAHRYREHFVYACPLCHPAFEAFKLYQQRKEIYGLKPAGINTFGDGLKMAIVAQLQSEKRIDRLKAIESLTTKWIQQRMDIMRLTDEERAAVAQLLEEGRKSGMEMLERQIKESKGKHDPNWKSCAICDGSVGACKLNPTKDD